MVAPQVDLLTALVAVEIRVELCGDHRLARPAAEELVAPLAVEDGGEPRVSCRPPEQILRPRDRITERQIELPDHVRQDRGDVGAADGHERERDAEVRRHLRGLLLLDAVSPEVEAERPHPRPRLLEPGGHARRIESAGEKDAHLGLAIEPRGDGLLAAAADERTGRSPVGERRIDPLAKHEVGLALEPTGVPAGDPPRQQPAHADDRRLLAGHEREREVFVDGGGIDLDREARDGEQLLDLAGEVEDARVLACVERPVAEGIADERQPTAVAIPPGGRERTVEGVEPLRQVLAENCCG